MKLIIYSNYIALYNERYILILILAIILFLFYPHDFFLLTSRAVSLQRSYYDRHDVEHLRFTFSLIYFPRRN